MARPPVDSKKSARSSGIDVQMQVKENATHQIDAARVLLSGPSTSAYLSTVMYDHLQGRTIRRFRNEGDEAVGGPWQPLNDYTVAIRQSQGYGGDGPINRRTGKMEAFITGSGPGVRSTAEAASLFFPENLPSGEMKRKIERAQRGSRFPATPPRPVLAVDWSDMVFFLTSFSWWFAERMNRATNNALGQTINRLFP